MIKRNLKITLAILFTSLLLTGCAQWQNVTGIQKIKSQKITYDLKESQWHAFNNENFETYNLTKDGLLLQDINIRRVDLNNALLSSKKSIPEDILPHELSEVIIENLKLDSTLKSLKIISNKPESIANKNGVNISFQTKDDYGNLIKTNATFFIFDKKLYNLSYTAPVQYFYDKELKEYNSIKKSISLNI